MNWIWIVVVGGVLLVGAVVGGIWWGRRKSAPVFSGKTRDQVEAERERIADHHEARARSIDAEADSLEDAFEKKFGG